MTICWGEKLNKNHATEYNPFCAPGHLQSNNTRDDRARVASNPHLDAASGTRVHHDFDALHHVESHVADLEYAKKLIQILGRG